MDPIEAFRAEDASLAVIGAGGKKTTMYRLAERLDRPVVTATVRIPIFDDEVSRVETTPDPVRAVEEASADSFPLGVIPERERTDRYRGYDVEVVEDLIDAHDGSVLIKADGARLREFKAPNETEPQLPGTVEVVVPVVSAAVVGEPLTDDVVHRPERVVRVARDGGVDAELGEPITPEIVGTVLASPDGGLKGTPPSAVAIPLVNKVDDDRREEVGRGIAETVRARLREDVDRDARTGSVDVPHVVLARMLDPTIIATIPV